MISLRELSRAKLGAEVSDYAADIDIEPAPPPEITDEALMQVPVGYVASNEGYSLFTVRLSRRFLAGNHNLLCLASDLATCTADAAWFAAERRVTGPRVNSGEFFPSPPVAGG